MNRQVLVYLVQHLESSRNTVDLINRRFKFCNAKLESMRTELEEAKDIGLLELASDLQSAVCKFEGMQVRAQRVRMAPCARIGVFSGVCSRAWSVPSYTRAMVFLQCTAGAAPKQHPNSMHAHANEGAGCDGVECGSWTQRKGSAAPSATSSRYNKCSRQ
jgi:hypothetical protein